jgi:capsular polysaccharide transport system permease protein
MRTRFGRTFFGYVFMVALPLSHLLFLMIMFLFVRAQLALMGTDAAVFWATGLLPYILCLYPSRMIMVCLAQNRPLMYFPIVKSFDIILARGLLEVCTAFWVTLIFGSILLLFRVDILPIHTFEALSAVLGTVFLGFSLGWIAAVMYKLTHTWVIVNVLLLLAMYLTAGIFFLPASLPLAAQNVIWFNPLLHAVEWLRSAYYEGYGDGLLSRQYLFLSSTVLLFIGVLLERLARGKLLQQ